MTSIGLLEAEVHVVADAAIAELLPRLLTQLLERDALSPCKRHDVLLAPYVQAQILFTRAKRNSEAPDRGYGTLNTEADYQQALERRDKIRAEYRATPCSCWEKHR